MNKAIENELAKLDQWKAETLRLEPIADAATAAAENFPDLSLRVDIVRRVAKKPFVAIRGDVDSFKQAVPVLQHLAKLGWHTHKANPFEDFHEIHRRTFNLCERDEFPPPAINPTTGEPIKEPSWARDYRLCLMLFLKSESKECKRVQVGTKQEPVYEFVCE